MNSNTSQGQTGAFPCAIQAWSKYEQPLSQWLFHQTQDPSLTEDLVQDVFIKVMLQQEAFCRVTNAKAWIFKAAKNLLIDQSRKQRFDPISTEVEQEEPLPNTLSLLASSCLSRVISELDDHEKEIIVACDLEGMNQEQFAKAHHLTLPATKSRLRRARVKLKKQIQVSCQVKLDENEQVCCFVPRKKQ